MNHPTLRHQAPESYDWHRGRHTAFLLVLAAALVCAVLVSLWCGSYETPLPELVRGVFGRAADKSVNTVVRSLRLPRICTALLGGAGLGICGCVLQSVLRNPLASASTLGISQGASFGAAFAIVVLGAGIQSGSSASGSMSFTSPVTISVCAFVCSMAVSLVILALSRLRSITPEAMVLAGVALSSLFSGASTLLQYFADDVQLSSVVFWTFGDLGRTSWREVRIMALVVLAATAVFLVNRWNYNALESGAHTAVSLGIHVQGLRLWNVLVCSLVCSVVAAYVGVINFIGLVAPHLVRRMVGGNYCWLLPGSALMGSLLLLLGDLAARQVLSPVVLPIGAITSFLGAPLFLYMLFKGRDRL